ncbi:hypothetical protein L8C07_18255 [Paenibacillus sp. CMAA1739]|uniref:hypothetical protein n=1 Tax=Paenibacillus ottowii TaxID=2315729 RepID=UPI002DB95CFE|nr:hypothetical protein [Paenibacillus sp. CMAA1739]MEC4567896.1 hypothetical protein [Paenibacillus sp. CMAA1739]
MKKIRSDHAPDFFAHAYDHCESRKSASSRGRFHKTPILTGMVKKQQAPGKRRLAVCNLLGLLVAFKYF